MCFHFYPVLIAGNPAIIAGILFSLQGILIRRACGHVDVGTCSRQVLADTSTLSQTEGADYAYPILVSTPSFESHRRA